MEMLTLYRGIAVPRSKAKMIADNIKEKGIKGDEGFWRFIYKDLRARINELFNKPDLSRNDTIYSKQYNEFPVVCVADELGAHYYALVHNWNSEDNTPIVITLKVPITDVYVDGRDFLYTCFGSCKSYQTVEILKELYGSSIEKYFLKAISSSDLRYRYAMCDLATQDLDVIVAHYKNKTIIRGRYNTHFRSAFFVRAPIPPDRIKDVQIIDVESEKYGDKEIIKIPSKFTFITCLYELTIRYPSYTRILKRELISLSLNNCPNPRIVSLNDVRQMDEWGRKFQPS